MSYSINEIQTLAQKAAMGAGFPCAQAETFGKAAVAHLIEGGAPEVLLGALSKPHDSPILRLHLLMDDVLRAVRAMGGDVSLSLHQEDGALAKAYVRTLPIRVSNVTIEDREDATSKLHLSTEPGSHVELEIPARLTIPNDFGDTLRTLAARTYVPSSDASRLAGAGAGLTDND